MAGSKNATWLRPALTGVAIPHQELGRRATRLLLAPEPVEGLELVPMPLRERSSVAAPRSDARVGTREHG